jgi:hypothetical protein
MPGIRMVSRWADSEHELFGKRKLIATFPRCGGMAEGGWHGRETGCPAD